MTKTILFVASGLAMMLLVACNRTTDKAVHQGDEVQKLTIHLTDGLNEKYLLDNYAELGLRDPKRINRTLNIYLVEVNAEDQNTLEKALSQDDSVLEISVMTATDNKIQSSKSIGSSKINLKNKDK